MGISVNCPVTGSILTNSPVDVEPTSVAAAEAAERKSSPTMRSESPTKCPIPPIGQTYSLGWLSV